MIPANHRSMARPASHSTICMAALYSTPGLCRCARCNPEPNSGATGPAPDAAARSLNDPTGGGTSSHPGDALVACQASPDPAADRNPSLSDAPIGGLLHQERRG